MSDPKISLQGVRKDPDGVTCTWTMHTEGIESWEDIIVAAASLIRYVIYDAAAGAPNANFAAYVLGRVADKLSLLKDTEETKDDQD